MVISLRNPPRVFDVLDGRGHQLAAAGEVMQLGAA